jgi:hypothetical protein
LGKYLQPGKCLSHGKYIDGKYPKWQNTPKTPLKRVKTAIFQFFDLSPGASGCDTFASIRWDRVKDVGMKGISRGKGYCSILYMVLLILFILFLYMDSSSTSLMPPGLFFIGLLDELYRYYYCIMNIGYIPFLSARVVKVQMGK